MATFHVKAKTSWKTVDIESAGFSQKDLEGLISLQELTDYEIVEPSNKKWQKGRQMTSGIDSDGQETGSGEESKGKKEKAKERKMKQKEKRKNAKEKHQQEKKAPSETDVKEQEARRKKRKEKAKERILQIKERRKKAKEKKEKEESGQEKDKALEIKDNTIHDTKMKQKKKSLDKKKALDKAVIKGEVQDVEDINELMEAESTETKSTEMNKQQKDSPKKRKKTNDAGTNSPVKKAKLDVSTGKYTEPADRSLKGMDAWKDLFVPEEVLWALKGQGFIEPTPIQRQILPSAIRDKLDVVGAAETGSGKTLAFGIPLLHFIVEHKRKEEERLSHVLDEMESDKDEVGIKQEDTESDAENSDSDIGETENVIDEDSDNNVTLSEAVGEENDEDSDSNNDEDADENTIEMDNEEGESSGEELGDLEAGGTGCVKVIKDVDFSWLKEPEVKTQRVTHPRALILEPTRELAIQVRNHLLAAAQHTDVTIAAIVGGLAMPKQQRILKKCPDILVATPGRLWELVQQGEVYLSEIEKTNHLVVDEADRMIEKGHFEELEKLLEKMKRDPNRQNRHTYVFSATLTLIHTGPKRMMKKKKKQYDEKQKLAYLMRKMGLKEKPKVVDLTRKVGTVETLTEARINCTKDEKDIYLYYFLKHYPGRTLVFTNSKDCIRRLVSIFTLLHCNPLPLHADMHQKQRLKNLEKFTGNPTSLLMASDVAARGLDIPNVQHVIHYQVPLTVENYVHRSGRTARASKEGLSIMLIGPEDVKNYRKVIHTLNKNEDLPLFPMEQEVLPEIKRRVNMVREIETQEYRFNKSKRKNDWFRKAADEIGVDIEDEGLLDDLGDGVEQQRHQQYIKQMKQELSILLKQQLLTGSSFTKYPTMSGKLVTPPTQDNKGDALTHVKSKKKVPEEQHEITNISQKQLKKRERRRKIKKRNKMNS